MINIGLPKGNVLSKSKQLVERITGKPVVAGRLSVEYENYRFFFLKHRDIPGLVEQGVLNYGITSDEWIAETDARVIRFKELDWCDTKIALIEHKDASNKPRSCVTEFQNIARKYLPKDVHIHYISGSSEAMVPFMFDCCIDCVESGATLVRNNLVIKDILLSSKIVVIGGQVHNEDNLLKNIL